MPGKRSGLDALLKGVARREFDIVAAWSVFRLGRSLSDLTGLLSDLRFRRCRTHCCQFGSSDSEQIADWDPTTTSDMLMQHRTHSSTD